MQTLLYLSSLSVVCLLLEIFGLRKLIRWFAIAALAVIGYFNFNSTSLNDVKAHYMVLTDPFGGMFSALFIGLTMLFILLSGYFYRNESSKVSDYLSLKLFALCGAVAMVTFGNLSMFFLGLEVLSISLYTLAGANKKDKKSNEAAMKYFLMGAFASGVLLFGIALVYGVTGSFNIADIASYSRTENVHHLFKLGVLFILFASLFKISAVPFHFWAPDVYEGSPSLHTAFMSTLGKTAAVASFYRLFSSCFMPQVFEFNWILAAITALTMVVGTLSALNQNSVKRMLAFSGVSNAGFMMIAIISMGAGSEQALFYYATAYTLSMVLAFSIIIAVTEPAGNDLITAFSGLGKKQPYLAAALGIALLSMAGIPPLSGFFGKYFLFNEAIQNGYLLLVLVAVISSIVSVYIYFKLILAMFGDEGFTSEVKLDNGYKLVVIVAVFLLLVLGLFPGLLLNLYAIGS